MIQVFKTDEDYKKWLDGQRLPSGIVVYVSDDETMYFSTNNIKGELKTYKCEKEEPIQYPPLVYSTNAAGSTITVNGQSMTLGQGENITLEYPTAITSVKATSNTALTAIQIPNTVTSIESTAFNSCPYLASVNIPDTVTSIEGRAFEGCTALTDFNFNGTKAQWGAITLGNGWKDNAAFTVVHCTDGDVSLEEVIPPTPLVYSTNAAGSTITVNGQSMTLVQGDNITLDYPNEITSVKASRNTALTAITIPNTVTSIEDSAFEGCTSLTSVNIQNGTTTIGGYTFYYCSAMTSVTLPESLTNIGGSSFRNCNRLASITIPNSVTIINAYAFRDCSNLTDFNFNGTTSQWASITLGTNWKDNAAFTVVHCTDGDVTL